MGGDFAARGLAFPARHGHGTEPAAESSRGPRQTKPTGQALSHAPAACYYNPHRVVLVATTELAGDPATGFFDSRLGATVRRCQGVSSLHRRRGTGEGVRGAESLD